MDVNTKEVFYDKLTYIYLEMPKFQKTEEELETIADKWLYALKNLSRLLERPKALQDRIFKKFFDVAEIANLSKDEYVKYLESEKVYYDNDGAIRTAEAKGRAKERLANAKALLGNGVPLELIVKSLNLTKEEADLITLSLDQ